MDRFRSFTIFLVVIFHPTLLYTEFSPVQNHIPDMYNKIFMGISTLINGPLLNSIMFFIAGFFAFETYQGIVCPCIIWVLADLLKKYTPPLRNVL